jgi:hypothetical protein
MGRSDTVRQTSASPSAAMLRALPEARLREVYLLSDKVADAEMRSTLMEAMRAWLRVERPTRRATALRRFCEPFEHLLCGPVGRNRKPFRIPRTVIAPLWALIRQQAGADSLDVLSLDVLYGHLQAAIAKARNDHRFARANAAGHHEFWEIAGEIDGAFQVRESVATMRRVLAENPAEQPTAEAQATFGTLIGSLASRDRRMVDLFLVLMVRHPPSTQAVLTMLGQLTRHTHGAIAADTLEVVYDSAIGDLQEKTDAALAGDAGTVDLHGVLDAVEPAARHLELLKQSADGRLPHNSARLRRLESDLRNVLVKRFLNEVEAQTLSHAQSLQDLVAEGASPADRLAFTKAMKALSRSRALFQTVGEGDAWKRQVEEVRATVSGELEALARNAAEAGPTGKRAALDGVVATLHALEQVCASSALMPLLVNGFSALGADGGGDFFIGFIRHMNGDRDQQMGVVRTEEPRKGTPLPLK